ncbi:diguanylate cyclase (GGDEF) domain-containing protein [Treponema bryantii]|uniref:diguanylate cyclase n=1 Tax=Treponema bryantii TaxID=163 RepID=A0A1I3JUS7_9SPIR|nr:GGDEF domain-containing protein [Treponema bryantii]SFI63963.1 diguanylate cyclase (GGDEF) domain-containing protein [Treponema bryantii]
MGRIISALQNIRLNIFSPKVSLEKRITYAMVFCSMVGEIIGFIESYLLGLPLIAVLLPLFSAIFLFFLSLWGLKTKKSRLFATISISTSALIFFPLMFFANSGLHGGMPYYFLVAVVCTALALRGRTRIIIFILILIEYSALFALYHFYPQGFIGMSHEDAFVDQLCSMLIASIVLFGFSFIVSKQNYHDRHKIEQLSLLYERQANTDELTGLYNRRYFNNFLKLAILTLGDTGKLHIAMFDIDDFKYVNDKYGHPFGDTVLKQFAEILEETKTAGITACRYGGEEFLLLIPKTNQEDALELVKEVLVRTREKIKLDDTKFVTVSAGFMTCSEDMTYDVLLQEVDKKLYIAKSSGKNCVIS